MRALGKGSPGDEAGAMLRRMQLRVRNVKFSDLLFVMPKSAVQSASLHLNGKDDPLLDLYYIQEGRNYTNIDKDGDWNIEDSQMKTEKDVTRCRHGNYDRLLRWCTTDLLDICKNENNVFGLSLYACSQLKRKICFK